MSKVNAHYEQIDPRNEARSYVPEVDSIVMCIIACSVVRNIIITLIDIDLILMNINPRTAGGLSHLRTVGGGGAHMCPPPGRAYVPPPPG